MTGEAHSHYRPRMIVRTSLNDVWPIAFKRRHGLLGRTNDGDVSRLMVIRIRENYEHEVATIGLHLRRFRTGDSAPALVRGFSTGQPLGLRIR